MQNVTTSIWWDVINWGVNYIGNIMCYERMALLLLLTFLFLFSKLRKHKCFSTEQNVSGFICHW